MNGDVVSTTTGGAPDQHRRSSETTVVSPEATGNTTGRSAVARATRRFLFQVFWRTAAVAALLIAISVFALFAGFQRLSVGEITDEIASSLLLREQMLTSLHSWAVPSLTSLLNDPIVKSAVYGANHNVVDLAESIQRLQHVAGNNPLIHSLYLFNPRSQLVLSTRSGVERERTTDPDLVSVIERSRRYDSIEFIPRTIRLRAGYVPDPSLSPQPEERVLTLVFFDRQFHDSPLEGCLVANLSEERLRRMFMEETTTADSQFMVVNQEGVAFSHYDPERFAQQVIRETSLESVFHDPERVVKETVTLDGRKSLVVSVNHSGTGWRLMSITDTGDLTTEIAGLRNVMVMVLLAVIVLTIPASFVVARQVSLPVHRIVEQAARLLPETEQSEQDSEEPKSEIGYLDQVLQKLGQRVRELDEQVRERRLSGHRVALHQLLEGTYDPEALTGELPTVLTEAPACAVVVIRFDRYSRLLEAVDGRMLRSMFQTISQLVPEYATTQGWFVDFGGDHAAVVHAMPGEWQRPGRWSGLNGSSGGAAEAHDNRTAPDIGPAQLTGEYQHLLHRVWATLELSMTVGVSSPVTEVTDIPRAYEHALRATDYRFRYGSGRVISAGTIEPDDPSYRFPQELVRHMLESLRLGKTEAAKQMLERVIMDARQASYGDYLFTVQMLVRMTRRELLDKLPENVGTDRTLRSLVDEISRVDTAEEVLESFAEAFKLFGEQMDADREQRNQMVVHRVKTIIDDAISDPALSVDLIAEQVGLSTNYLRDLFKSSTGTSISNLILDKRITLSQQLLTTTNSSVKEIAASSGFQSYNYFFTAFKRSTGMTPRQYRTNLTQ